MYYIYMDSGTTNTRVYLLNEFELVDGTSVAVGTKDSAISGSNDVLLYAMKQCCDELLNKNGLQYENVEQMWISGMVTSHFGFAEVEHVSTPVDAKKLLEHVYVYEENELFKRKMYLICGAKTAQPDQIIDTLNIDKMNNVRGEEIEAVGMVATGILPEDEDCVMISPGSHTHICHVVNGAIVDIISNFTGELNYAIQQDTILAGELSEEEVPMEKEYVKRGYEYLKEYGICRALYVIHATRIFDVCSDEVRSQILSGIISGSVIELLAKKIEKDWKNVKRIVIIGNKSYIESYRILCEILIPNIPATIVDSYNGKSFALCGFLELLKRSKNE